MFRVVRICFLTSLAKNHNQMFNHHHDSRLRIVLSLDRNSYSISSSETKTNNSPSRLSLDHLVEQSHQKASARGAYRVAQRNGAAIDVDSPRVKFQFAYQR